MKGMDMCMHLCAFEFGFCIDLYMHLCVFEYVFCMDFYMHLFVFEYGVCMGLYMHVCAGVLRGLGGRVSTSVIVCGLFAF